MPSLLRLALEVARAVTSHPLSPAARCLLPLVERCWLPPAAAAVAADGALPEGSVPRARMDSSLGCGRARSQVLAYDSLDC